VRKLLWLAIAADAALFAGLSILRHRAFETGRFDLGNMTQAVWSTAEARPLEMTSLGGEQFTRLGAHFDPLLALLAPLWLAWPSPEALLVAQSLALALGALPVFRLARRRLPARGAFWLALAYLLLPALQWQTLADFHAVALATPLLLFAIDALDDDRLTAFAVFAGLAVLTKEHVGLAVAGLGLWYALSRRRRPGWAIAGAGVAVSAVAVLVVIPHFTPGGESAFAGRYDEPALGARDAGYALRLLLPLALTPLLAPALLVAALPELAINVLSETVTQTSIRYHYSATILAVLTAAAVVARRPRLTVAAALVATLALGPLPRLDLGIEARDRAAQAAVELVPRGAAVSASNALGAHLSARRRILSFPRLGNASWVAVADWDVAFGQGVTSDEHLAAIARLRRDPAWRRVYAREGVLVFRRESSAEGGTG
jgi:uncharacterized membrane protein